VSKLRRLCILRAKCGILYGNLLLLSVHEHSMEPAAGGWINRFSPPKVRSGKVFILRLEDAAWYLGLGGKG